MEEISEFVKRALVTDQANLLLQAIDAAQSGDETLYKAYAKDFAVVSEQLGGPDPRILDLLVMLDDIYQDARQEPVPGASSEAEVPLDYPRRDAA